jgi:hypothetical protein
MAVEREGNCENVESMLAVVPEEKTENVESMLAVVPKEECQYVKIMLAVVREGNSEDVRSMVAVVPEEKSENTESMLAVVPEGYSDHVTSISTSNTHSTMSCLLLHFSAELRHLQRACTPTLRSHSSTTRYNSNTYYIVVISAAEFRSVISCTTWLQFHVQAWQILVVSSLYQSSNFVLEPIWILCLYYMSYCWVSV